MGVILTFILWVCLRLYFIQHSDNKIAYAVDGYKLAVDFALNDLIAVYYYFTSANPVIHVLIGAILFVLTVFLFTTVTFYTTAHITSKSVFKTVPNKLFVPRGYYEQSPENSQKFFYKNDNK